jgi:hypothetical protein
MTHGMTPPPSLSLEGYARALGADEPRIAAPSVLVPVEVESGTGWGRVELLRGPTPERATVIEWL